MKFEKELIELYGFILGDGTSRKDKYQNMTFYNYNLELMKYIQNLIEKINGKIVKINERSRKTGIEYSINIPASIRKVLVYLGFNKERVPLWILESEHGIFFLKSLFECEGSLNGSQIMIHQKNRKELLGDCVKIANRFGLSAHVHDSSKNRSFEYYLAIEDTEKIHRIFGKTIKLVIPRSIGKGNRYYTERKILQILNDVSWLTTTEIKDKLQENGIHLNRKKMLIHNHLKPLNEVGIILRCKDVASRDNKGRIVRSDSKWKLGVKLTPSQILNFPYGVVK